jgi:hypothetical protein
LMHTSILPDLYQIVKAKGREKKAKKAETIVSAKRIKENALKKKSQAVKRSYLFA